MSQQNKRGSELPFVVDDLDCIDDMPKTPTLIVIAVCCVAVMVMCAAMGVF